jgi:uncharacterized protein DUF4410
MNPVRIRPLHFVAAVVLGAAFLPACHHGIAVSNDPTKPVFKMDGADFSKYQVVKMHFVEVKTNNNEGVDLLRSAFEDSIKTHFGPHFKTVAAGDTAAAGEILMDISLNVNWGSRGARMFVGFGAGKADIQMKYELKDGATLLSSLNEHDSMSGGADSRALAFAAADKWNKWYVANVLFPAGAPAHK